MKRPSAGLIIAVAFLPISVGLTVVHGLSWIANPGSGWALISAIASLVELGFGVALIKEYGGIPRRRVVKVEPNREDPLHEPRIAVRLLELILPSDETQPLVIGDLLEEFNQSPSKLKAYLWLYGQAFKSIPPLVYRSVRSRLASYFGRRTR